MPQTVLVSGHDNVRLPAVVQSHARTASSGSKGLCLLHLDSEAKTFGLMRRALSTLPIANLVEYQTITIIDAFVDEVSRRQPDFVLIDLNLGVDSGRGIDLIRQLRKNGFKGELLVQSDFTELSIIRASLEAGASDFVDRERGLQEIIHHVTRYATHLQAKEPTASALGPQPAGGLMRDIMRRLPRVLESNISSVLVRGETGTGKEVVAELLRSHLPKGTPFVSVNCAAISESLLESELFGHERGAFTGASARKTGLFAAADGGWIFLDEVARLSASCQAALLRVLESGEVRMVGSSSRSFVKVRVIAATNEDLDAMAGNGLFRQDLLQRLNGVEILLKPLRERREEIGEILDALLATLNQASSRADQPYRITPAARMLLLGYDWSRGNVREMKQVFVASTIDAHKGLITASCLPPRLLASLKQAAEVEEGQVVHGKADLGPSSILEEGKMSLPDLEDALLLKCMDEIVRKMPSTPQTQRKMASHLGITRYTLFSKLRKLVSAGKLPQRYRYLLPGGDQGEQLRAHLASGA